MKKTFYVHLYHGRKDPEQTMEDWGEDGPILGPFTDLLEEAAPEEREAYLLLGYKLRFCAMDIQKEMEDRYR